MISCLLSCTPSPFWKRVSLKTNQFAPKSFPFGACLFFFFFSKAVKTFSDNIVSLESAFILLGVTCVLQRTCYVGVFGDNKAHCIIVFLLKQNTCSGFSLEVPHRGSSSTNNIRFIRNIWDNYRRIVIKQRKPAHSNILKILPSKMKIFR